MGVEDTVSAVAPWSIVMADTVVSVEATETGSPAITFDDDDVMASCFLRNDSRQRSLFFSSHC